jgi:prepilin-type N-terminal cleavage/methylation domain-containing protein
MQTSFQPPRPSLRRGYTMLELVIVLTIVGIVSAMSVGRIHDLLIHERVVRAATAMQNDLEAAFAIAGRNRRPVRISWDAASMRLGVTDRAGTLRYRTIALGGDAYGLTSSNVNVSRSPVEIYPNGFANDTLTITLTGVNVSRKIRVSRAGLVRVE